MKKTGAKPVWAGREFRLDPFHLPQTVTYATRDDRDDITFTLHERGRGGEAVAAGKSSACFARLASLVPFSA